MTPPSSQSLSPRAWAIIVWLSAIFINVNVSGVVVLLEQQWLIAHGVSARVLKDLENSPLTTDPKWLIVNASAVQLALLLCGIGWLWYFGLPDSLPFKRVPTRAWVGTFLVSLGALPIGGAAEELVRRTMGQELTTGLLIVRIANKSSVLELLGLLLSVAVLPGIAEEILFRGVITRQLSRYSKLEVLVLPSVLFGLAHLEPAQAAGTMILGLAFGFARLATGSILPAVAAHILNNGLVLSLAFLSQEEPTPESGIEWPMLLIAASVAASGVSLLTRPPLQS